ncbi:MAG TPA: hypothetical protein VGI85_07225 [Chthoniobacterales bacterium]|jgi:glucan phosphoethanolaminetransferase (alkaline phosphatase superfamily)
MLATLSQDLSQPEYIHVLINPLPVYGLLVATIGLVIALIQRSRRAQVATLALVLLSAAMAWPVVHFGEVAYDRVLSLTNAEGAAWLKVHMHRADQFVWFFYALAVVAAVAIFAPIRWPKSATILAIVTLLFACVVLAMGSYIGYAGGRIRHREFRNEPAPPVPVEQDDS